MKSEKNIFSRYEKEDNRYIIQISTNTYRDLFNKYDRTSSLIKRDLNDDLANYLFDAASDLYGRDFYICLNIHDEKRTEELEEMVNRGVDSYFEHEIHKIIKRRSQVAMKIAIHFLLAIACLFISYILNQVIALDSFLYMLFVESSVIAAWVLMWPILSDFMYDLFDIRRTLGIYKKIVDADLKFHYV